MKILCSPVWDVSENTKTQYWTHSNLYGKHQSGLSWKTEMWSPWITAKDACLPGPGWASFHWLLSILKSPSLLLLHYMKLITNVLSPLIQDRSLLWLAAGAAMRSHSPHPAVCSFRVWAGVQLLFIRWRVRLPRGRKQDPRLLPHLPRCVWAHV